MKTQSLRERLRESTSTAILDAAEAVGAVDGLAGMTLQAVAQRAGIAVGTIYNYFDDRSELIAALFARRREEFVKAMDASAKAHAREGFDGQLEALVRVVLHFFDSRRAFLRLALEAHDEPSVIKKADDTSRRATMNQLTAHAERVVRVGTKEKRLRDDGAHLFATALVAVLKGVLFARAEAETKLEAETEAIVQLFLHGVAR
jgi:AcrR family transcriptional regulator